MKKIMFNDRFGLTDAVLEGRKTVTRRIVTDEIYGESYIDDNPPRIDEIHRPTTNSKYIKSHLSKYQVGEVVAVAQSLQNIGLGDNGSVAWTNKMFVKAELMHHQIEILDVRAERLQDITNQDCMKEGIRVINKKPICVIPLYGIEEMQPLGKSAKEAYAILIDKISGKGTWESNPYVFRYEFKLK